MRNVKLNLLIIGLVAAFVVGFAAAPAQAVRVLWRAPNVNITLGLNYSNVEFEDPWAVGKRVKGYRIIDWRDADYSAGPPRWYDEWLVSNSSEIDGHPNEIWMRKAGHYIWTDTTVASRVVSIHLVGDNNDGVAYVYVDNILKAILDMGTKGTAQTALVIVKRLTYNTHEVKVVDRGKGWRSRCGDDVAVLGAAALRGDLRYKWWPRFWFLNARIRLVRTRGTIVVPTGFWGGWWWWHHQCHWFRPWHGPVWWYKRYCRYWYRPFWPHWPRYRYYRPWWHHWRWRGGRWFWGFKDCLRFRYTYWRPRIIYWWSWYWDPGDEGNCFELVLQSNEDDPNGGRVLPFEQPGIPGFEYEDHEFSVHGGKVDSNFTPLRFVEIGEHGDNLRSEFMYETGADANEADAFMASEMIQELLRRDPCGVGYVGIQHASWTHPEGTSYDPPAMIVDADNEMVFEGDPNGDGLDRLSWDVNLPEEPNGSVTVKVVSSDPEDLGIEDADPNTGVLTLEFDEYNWSAPQTVTVVAADDDYSEGEKTVMVAHYFEHDPNEGFPVEVTIIDNECGGLGYDEADLDKNCVVDFHDVSVLADGWLVSTDPMDMAL